MFCMGRILRAEDDPFGELRDQLEEVAASIGLRRSFGRFALKLGTVSVFASAIIG